MHRKARIESITLAFLIVAASFLSVLMTASPVSAADYASTTRYWALDKAYGAVGDTQTVGSPGNNYFTLQFYYEIWLALAPMVYPSHICHLHMFVESSSSNQYAVDFVNTVYDHSAVVNWVYNPYNAPYSSWASSYTRTLSDGTEYVVYYGAVTYGPTLNPLPGVPIHAYMEWWGESVYGFTWAYSPASTNWKFVGKVIVVPLVAPEIWFDNSHALPPPPPSGGGGCVLRDTNILMADGKTMPVQAIKTGDEIMGYNVQTGTFVRETVTSNERTLVDKILSINDGLLYLTPTDQPIYTDHGWIRDPQSLKIGWKIYFPTKGTWTTIYSLKTLKGHFKVYDLRATKPDTFIGNGVLLDFK